jgi:type I restriction-modification system DNA methylase subunit
LNIGSKAKNIFAYNGGLFEPDAIIDNLNPPISNVLETNLLLLEAYDYNTQVDVAILGHIFEQSLNDLDEMKALAAGEILDKTKTKRKKDGVFYTPQYITRYIVENTVGVLCAEKRTELGIAEGKKTTEQALLAYREWLQTVTVLDPACGSGAFLNEVLAFFMQEHEAIEERIAGVADRPVVYRDYSIEILENNIFGVDLNEEAVEIAKLSLWLRTARIGRKLSDLSQNIKTRNSLIDDKKIDKKAFNWQKEFPKVFAASLANSTKAGTSKIAAGFDIIVGNPPYGAKVSEKSLNYFINRFENYGINKRLNDTYFIFDAFCAAELLKKGGILGFITPNTWRLVEAATDFRRFMFSHFNFLQPYEKGKGKPVQTEKIMQEKPFTLKYKQDKTFVPLIGGSNFHKYLNLWHDDEYISYGEWLAAPRDADLFFNKKEKLIFRQTSDKLIGTLIQDGFVMRNNTHIILKTDERYDLRYILAVLNSKLLNFIYWTINPEKGEALAEVKAFHLGMLPVYTLEQKKQAPFATLADKMLSTNTQIEAKRRRLVAHLQEIFTEKLSLNKKINNWHSGTWYELIGELRKQKLTLLPKQETATKIAFDALQQEIKALQHLLKDTDAAIDALVYTLYELTPEEIALVEQRYF